MPRKVASFFLLFTMIVITAVPGFAESNTLQLTAATAHPADEVEAVVLAEFKRLVEEKTRGRIKVSIQTGGVRGSDEQLIKGLQQGSVDLITCPAFAYAEYVPAFTVLDLPFLFFSTQHLTDMLGGTLGQALTERAQESRGDYILGYITDGPVNMVNNKALIYMSQGKGLRFRTKLLPTHRQTWETLGIDPVTLAYSELKIGLQVGLVDVVETNYIDYKKMRIYDTARFILQSEHYFPISLLMLSKNAWYRIPASYRKLVRQCATDDILYGSTELIWQNKETARELTEKYGVKITELNLADKKSNYQKIIGVQERTFTSYGLTEAWREVKTTYAEYEKQMAAELERIKQIQEKTVKEEKEEE